MTGEIELLDGERVLEIEETVSVSTNDGEVRFSLEELADESNIPVGKLRKVFHSEPERLQFREPDQRALQDAVSSLVEAEKRFGNESDDSQDGKHVGFVECDGCGEMAVPYYKRRNSQNTRGNRCQSCGRQY